MRKTPSYLKGLAETRARVSAEVARLERLQADIAAELDKARLELTSCDTLIKRFDERLNPNLIQPVRAWKGRYGQRGALREAIADYLQKAAPNEVSTDELGFYLQAHFHLDFQTAHEVREWQHNSVCRAIKVLMDRGLVERLHSTDINGGAGHVGRWRWVGKAETIAALATRARAVGVPTSSSQVVLRGDAADEAESACFSEDTDELLPV